MTTSTAGRPAPRRTGRAGRVVAAQAAVALPVAAAPYGPGAVAAAGIAAVAVCALAWLRVRQRWVSEWAAVGLAYLTRRRTLRCAPDGLCACAAPGSRLLPAELAGDDAAVLADGYGLTAVVEVGDPTGILVAGDQPLPGPAELAALAGADGPPLRGQVVLSSRPAPAARLGQAPAAASYRQLTDGQVAADARTLLTLCAPAGGWSAEELRRALSSAVRKLRQRYPALAARPLGAEALRRTLHDLAHHEPRRTGAESWAAVRSGALLQAGYLLDLPPDAASTGRLLARLRALPAVATTVALTQAPTATVRLAAPDGEALAGCARRLQEAAAAHRVRVVALDGRHRRALAATLPLGATAPAPVAAASAPAHPGPAGAALRTPRAGLMVGVNRDGVPVLVRLFRPEPTRALLVGGVAAAQLLAVRALAAGARVVVRTTRPGAWEPFARAAGAPGAEVAVTLPATPEPGGDDPLHPLLSVLDAGPVPYDLPADAAWRTQLVVRDELVAVDSATLALSDLVVLQPLRAAEADLVGAVLGLGAA
ncbi:MAG TPA: type VII secretion protein EccE, partial [Pilimelia sp.]|nr:type VII secretion protein EccE [Pilimelia sp.]